MLALDMRIYGKTVCATAGILLVMASLAGIVLVYLGPWRSCSETSVSYGCPGTPNDVGLLGFAVVVLVVGIVFIAASLSLREKMIPFDAVGPFKKL